MIEKQPLAIEQIPLAYRGYRVCWSAIFSGVFVGVGLGFLLRLYGVAINLSSFSAAPQNESVIAIGGFLGMIIGVIAAMATAGFVSGYLGRHHYYPLHGGVIYGFITWALIILISAILAKPLMHYTYLSGESLSATASMEKIQGQINSDTATANSNVPVANNAHANKNVAATPLSAKQLAWTSWMIFILFFVGALSSCIGACCGIRCTREIPLDR